MTMDGEAIFIDVLTATAVEGVEPAGEVRPGFDVVDNIYC